MKPTEPTAHIPNADERRVKPNFITEVVDADLQSGRLQQVVTRFPPEPNGYLHIGHAKAICLDFGLARDYGGRVHLRMDDTNPTTEDPSYVAAIERDVRWLGFDWDRFCYASDYFDALYDMAERLIEMGLAYVDMRDEATIRATRGSVSEPGTPSGDRDRTVAENLSLFRRMRAGEFPDGACVLRAKIDLASPNMIMRDPVLYRIKHAHHYRTGDDWCIYPLYDFAHPLSDAIEGITHSLCTLEFDNNRAIYDWLVGHLFEEPRPRQYEFARLVLERTVLSKRKLIALVGEGVVDGWDDPRMPTIAGLRRKGVPPEAIRRFVDALGITKTNATTDPALLDAAVRDTLNTVAPRVMAVLEPIELLLSDPDGELDGVDGVDAASFPEDVVAVAPERTDVSRVLPLGLRLHMERGDVAAVPPAGFKRMAPGRAIRLRHGPVVVCERVETDSGGVPTRVHARVLPGSLGRNPEGVKVWAAIHWVDAATAIPARFQQFGDLFEDEPTPSSGDAATQADATSGVRSDSLVVHDGFVEASVAGDDPSTRYQFERVGYFWRDPGPMLDAGAQPGAAAAVGAGAGSGRIVWNQIVALKSSTPKARPEARPEAPPEARSAARSEAAKPSPAVVTPAPVAAAGDAKGEANPLAALSAEARATAERWVGAGVDAVSAALMTEDTRLQGLFDAALAAGADAAAAAPWVAQETRASLRKGGEWAAVADGAALRELLALLADGTLNTPTARQVWAMVLAGEGRPRALVETKGLSSTGDAAALAGWIATVLRDHPEEVANYRAGKVALLGFFVGQVMRASGGRAEPKALQGALRQALDKG